MAPQCSSKAMDTGNPLKTLLLSQTTPNRFILYISNLWPGFELKLNDSITSAKFLILQIAILTRTAQKQLHQHSGTPVRLYSYTYTVFFLINILRQPDRHPIVLCPALVVGPVTPNRTVTPLSGVQLSLWGLSPRTGLSPHCPVSSSRCACLPPPIGPSPRSLCPALAARAYHPQLDGHLPPLLIMAASHTSHGRRDAPHLRLLLQVRAERAALCDVTDRHLR